MSGKVDVAPVITHFFRLDEYDQAIQTAESASGGKVVFRIYPEHSSRKDAESAEGEIIPGGGAPEGHGAARSPPRLLWLSADGSCVFPTGVFTSPHPLDSSTDGGNLSFNPRKIVIASPRSAM